jgi:hypothetical protein
MWRAVIIEFRGLELDADHFHRIGQTAVLYLQPLRAPSGEMAGGATGPL